MIKLILFSLVFAAAAGVAPSQTPNPNLIPPQVRSTPSVSVPKEARVTGLGGKVTVAVRVGADGKPIAVTRATGPDWVCPAVETADVAALRKAASDAAMRSTFAPATMGGVAQEAETTVSFDFPGTKSLALPSAVAASPAPTGNYSTAGMAKAPPQSSEPNRYTIIGHPPDYVGPVAGTSPPAAQQPGTPAPAAPSGQGKYTELLPGSRTLTGGVLNGKAMSLPKPAYPPAARAVRAAGAVTIQVLIDEAGSVFAAEPVSGHPLLRSSSRVAACSAAFSPTMLDGKPVKVSGVITYNFVP